MPDAVREQFRRYGRVGGRTRAARMSAAERSAVARRAAAARWIKERFGASSLEAVGLPGGALVDAGLRDLATGTSSAASLLVSLAAPRLRREGVPVGETEADPEYRLYALLSETEGDLAHARYEAYLGQAVSFANACSSARID